jgi:alpha-tubulin suppressor-like RCC1 family protein
VQDGGGDVDVACIPAPAGSGGTAGAGGVGGVSGAGGTGGGSQPPLKGECETGQKRCSADGLSECGADGQWQAPTACEIGCDKAKNECVVPVQLAAGKEHACALLSDGTVRCWGGDSRGQLGNGPGGDSVRPTPVVGLTGATSITASDFYSCATQSEGSKVSCWGATYYTSIVPDIQEIPVVIGSAQGRDHLGVSDSSLCLLKESGVVECKGKNDHGQLGNGGEEDSLIFTPTSGFPSPPRQISVAGFSACAVLADSTLACWGIKNTNGTNPPRDLPSPAIVNNVHSVRKVATSEAACCAIRIDNTMQCWGYNVFGELGRGFDSEYGVIEAPGFVDNFGDVERISPGSGHVCATKTDQSLWCWGRNNKYQLASTCESLQCSDSGNGPYISLPARVPLDNVVDVAAGDYSTCALTKDSKVYCWGSNEFGQVGNGAIGDKVLEPTLVHWK